MSFSVGVGLTNACDLACAHCYRDTARVDQLSLADVAEVCDTLPVRSINLGTGENGLHPDCADQYREDCARQVELLRCPQHVLEAQPRTWPSGSRRTGRWASYATR